MGNKVKATLIFGTALCVVGVFIWNWAIVFLLMFISLLILGSVGQLFKEEAKNIDNTEDARSPIDYQDLVEELIEHIQECPTQEMLNVYNYVWSTQVKIRDLVPDTYPEYKDWHERGLKLCGTKTSRSQSDEVPNISVKPKTSMFTDDMVKADILSELTILLKTSNVHDLMDAYNKLNDYRPYSVEEWRREMEERV